MHRTASRRCGDICASRATDRSTLPTAECDAVGIDDPGWVLADAKGR
jgi:hypothetical protein